MERHLSRDSRLSFNRPNAESTFRASLSNSPVLQWGRKNLNGTVSGINSSITRSPVRERNGLNKIDARTYVDVHSSGLSSRIVKYHEDYNSNCNGLTRSVSMNNMSSERRHFSPTRSAKPEVKCKSPKRCGSTISMTHIAPPIKSAFYGNTLSGLLRSNSIITLQHNDDDISSENRPIIHPVTERELQPTRSVLEVLKEISRKRINNEDADEDGTSKKYCNRVDGEINGSIQPDYRNAFVQPIQTHKRQRESAAECFNSNRSERIVYPSKSPDNRQEVSPPEQQAKRRQCNYTNDILSSLSSSKKISNKRKLFDYEGERQQEKQLRTQSEIRLPELSKALNYVAKTPITPLPNTPQSSYGISSNEIPLPAPAPVQKSISAPIETESSREQTKALPTKPKMTLFNMNYEPKPTKSAHEYSAPSNNVPYITPKECTSTSDNSAGRLFLERVQKSKLALMLAGLRGEVYLGDDDDVPIETQQKKQGENTTNSKSKSVQPAINTAPGNNTNAINVAPNSTAHTTVSLSAPTTVTFAQPTLSANLINATPNSNTNAVDGSTANSAVLTAGSPKSSAAPMPSTKIISPLTGIKLTPQTTSATSTTTTPIISFGTPTSVNSLNGQQLPKGTSSTTPFIMGGPTISGLTTTSQPSLPTLGTGTGKQTTPAFSIIPATVSAITAAISTAPPLFSFGKNPTSNTVSSNPATTTQSTLAPITTPVPLVGFGSSGSQPIVTTNPEMAKPTTAVATSFSFGGTKTSDGGFSIGGTANSTKTSAMTSNGSFSFGGAVNNPKTSTTTSDGGFDFGGTANNPKALTTTSDSGFSFGGSANSAKTSTTTSGGGFSFGGTTNSPKTSTTTSGGGFSFGGTTNSPKTSTTTPGGNFSFGGTGNSAKTSNTTSGGGFSFGGTTNSPKTSTLTSGSGFSFGGSANTAKTSSTNSDGGLNFGTTANTANTLATTAGSFSFGGTTNQNKLASAANVFGNTTTIAPIKFGASSTNEQTSQNTLQAQLAANNSANNAFGSKPAIVSNQDQTATNTFGGVIASGQNKPFSFGAVTATTNSTTAEPSKTTNIFSLPSNGTNKPFSFGGATSNSSVSPVNTTTPPAAINTTKTFSLANNNNNNNNQSNLFSFGGSNTNNNAIITPSEAPKATNNTFSFGSNTAQVKPFSFGASNAVAAKPTFGVDSSKSFGFGAAGNNTNTTNNNTFSFGSGGNSSNNEQPKMISSTGSNNAQPNALTFGGGAQSSVAPSATFGTAASNNIFNFSGSNNNGSTPATTSPSFNAFATDKPSMASGMAPATNPPSFGTVTPTQANTFVFGGGSNNTAKPTATAAGNLFAPANTANNNLAASPFGGGTANNVNLFAASPSNSDRPIRRATRRLPKF